MMPIPLSDSSKTYMKSACLISDNLSEAQAAQYCLDKGMHFFVIDSNKTQQALETAVTKLMGSADYVIRVDGVRDETGDGNWYYYTYGKTSAYTGLDWLIGPDTYDGQSTMILTNMAYPMSKFIKTPKIDGIEPDLVFPFACEYKL